VRESFASFILSLKTQIINSKERLLRFLQKAELNSRNERRIGASRKIIDKLRFGIYSRQVHLHKLVGNGLNCKL